MVVYTYLVEGKEVKVNAYIIMTTKPKMVFEIDADDETKSKYIDEKGIVFAVDVKQILDAIEEALSPSRMVRD